MIAVNNDTWMLILLLAVVFGALVAITTFSGRGSLDSIKSKTVGDGQHGTARWATQGDIKKTFRSVPCGGRGNASQAHRGWCWAVPERRGSSRPWWIRTISTAS